MSKYIDADKLITEIERRVRYMQTCIENEYRLSGKAEEEIILEYKHLQNFIASLQQEHTEAELEREIKVAKNADRYLVLDKGRLIEEISRYFYGLGELIVRKNMETLNDGWRKEIEEAIENAPIMMSGSAYTSGFKDGLKKALEILDNHI